MSKRVKMGIKTAFPNKGGKAVAKKSHRWRPGTVALREIRRYQQSTNLLLQRLPVARVIRECAADHDDEVRFAADVFSVLQEAAEARLVHNMENSLLACIHRKCITVQEKDGALVSSITSRLPRHL